MAQDTQDYKSHRQYVPSVHFFLIPVFIINVVVEAVRLYNMRTPYQVWSLVVAVALAVFPFAARGMSLRAQDRAIRLEERTRLASLLPAENRDMINQLTPSQLVALRFASDEEAADLAQRTMTGEFKTQNDIKKAVKKWRADTHRV